MNFWLFHHYAEPPDGYWTNHHELFREVILLGHEVTIFTSSFSHWSRKDTRLKPGENYKEETVEGVRYIFIRTTPYYDNGSRRYLNFLSYGWRAFVAGLRAKGKPDVVIGSSPHPFCAMDGYLISRFMRVPFFFEVHDLWPQFFVEVGAFSEKHPVTRVLRWMEKFLLIKAKKIFPLWPRMNLYFEKLGLPQKKIVWMPMGLNMEKIRASVNADPVARSEFVVQYRGRFGLTQNMMQILKAAKILQARDTLIPIRFAIVGEGPERESLLEKATELGLQNVTFRDFLPKSEMMRDMGQADVLLGSLPDLPHFKEYGMISTKLLDYLSANRPVIFSTGIQDHLVVKAGAGFVVPPGDAEALAEAILRLAEMPIDRRSVMGRNGIGYLLQNHDVKILAQRLLAAVK
jgi:glycosyltransferase involved in cell wall biosynthesis